VEGPAWLPPGPRSPNTDEAPDPASVYDTIGEDPSTCKATADAYKQKPGPEWQVIQGLAEACAAVQGRGGSWDKAAEQYALTQGKLTSCKGGTAYAVLGDILAFHRQHPSVTVKLKESTRGGGKAACDFRVASVNVKQARPGDLIRIELSGIHFDKGDFLRRLPFSVIIAGRTADVSPNDQPEPGPGDRMIVEVKVPAPAPGDYPKSADVKVEYGVSDTLENAFTIVAAEPTGPTDASSPPVPSVTP
jgi:hypothetical protein